MRILQTCKSEHFLCNKVSLLTVLDMHLQVKLGSISTLN